nr:MAG TPA: YjcQ protein [Caudoviricetes sp.]
MDGNKQQAYNELMEFEKTIYGILSAFEKQLDKASFNLDILKARTWNVSEVRFIRYLKMLLNAGYIDGITITPLSDSQYYIKSDNATITLKGLEYLAENSMMRKVADILKKGASITIQSVSEAVADKIIK